MLLSISWISVVRFGIRVSQKDFTSAFVLLRGLLGLLVLTLSLFLSQGLRKGRCSCFPGALWGLGRPGGSWGMTTIAVTWSRWHLGGQESFKSLDFVCFWFVFQALDVFPMALWPSLAGVACMMAVTWPADKTQGMKVKFWLKMCEIPGHPSLKKIILLARTIYRWNIM